MQDSPRTGSFRAVVQAGGRATEYLRSGKGRPLLVLSREPLEQPPWPELLEALATRFRVMAPATIGANDFDDWLRQFLDGLGVTAVAALAAETLGTSLVNFAVRDRDRVDRVAILVGPMQPEVVSETSGVPLLMIRSNRTTAAVVDQLSDFLGPGS